LQVRAWQMGVYQQCFIEMWCGGVGEINPYPHNYIGYENAPAEKRESGTAVANNGVPGAWWGLEAQEHSNQGVH
jgi:hypothetical protein